MFSLTECRQSFLTIGNKEAYPVSTHVRRFLSVPLKRQGCIKLIKNERSSRKILKASEVLLTIMLYPTVPLLATLKLLHRPLNSVYGRRCQTLTAPKSKENVIKSIPKNFKTSSIILSGSTFLIQNKP
jgi:hypothetical protein